MRGFGFADPESGVDALMVEIVADGTTIFYGQGGAGALEVDTPGLSLNNGTSLVARAFAVNGAGQNGTISPDVTMLLVLTAIDPGAVWVADAFGSALSNGSLITTNDQLGLLYSGARDPSGGATGFEYYWRMLSAPCDATAARIELGMIYEATAAWRSSTITAADGTVDAVRHVATYQPALVSGTAYCLQLTACTLGTPSARCVDATTAQYVFDDSPPTASCAMRPGENATDRGTETPLSVRVSCTDANSGVSSAQLSLGTAEGAADLLDHFELVGLNGTAGSVGFSGVMNGSTLRGRVSVPKVALISSPAEGTLIYASLRCVDRPGFAAKYASPCLLYTSPSPRDRQKSRMPSSA